MELESSRLKDWFLMGLLFVGLLLIWCSIMLFGLVINFANADEYNEYRMDSQGNYETWIHQQNRNGSERSVGFKTRTRRMEDGFNVPTSSYERRIVPRTRYNRDKRRMGR